MGLRFDVDTMEVRRGGTVAGTLSGLDDGEQATVALVAVEHLPLTIPTKRTILTDTVVRGAGSHQVTLQVPLDAPSSHDSPRASVTIEVEAVRERRGPDERDATELVLLPGRDNDHERRLQRTFPPAPEGSVEHHPWHHQLGGKLGVLAVVVVIGVWQFEGVWRAVLIAGGVLVTALTVYAEWRRSKAVPVGVAYKVAANPVRAGEPAQIQVRAPMDTNIEVGYRVVEVVITNTGGNSARVGRTRTILHEEWTPAGVGTRTVAVPTAADQPPSFGGYWVRIEHELVLRPADSKVVGGIAPGDTIIPLLVVP